MVILLCDSCTKKEEEKPGYSSHTDFNEISAFLAASAPKKILFSNDALQEMTLVSSRGGLVTIPAGIIVDAQGNPVSGTVDYEFTQYLTKSDMIYSGVTTLTSDGKLLESGGMANLRATVDGQEVFIKKGDLVTVIFPTALKPFLGYIGRSGSDGVNHVTWELRPGALRIDSLTKQLALGLDSFGYWNLDRLDSSVSRTDVMVTLPSFCTKLDTRVVLVNKDANSVCYLYNSGTNREWDISGIPLGLNAKLLVIQLKDNHLKYAIRDITIRQDHKLSIDWLDDISEFDLSAVIKSMN